MLEQCQVSCILFGVWDSLYLCKKGPCFFLRVMWVFPLQTQYVSLNGSQHTCGTPQFRPQNITKHFLPTPRSTRHLRNPLYNPNPKPYTLNLNLSPKTGHKSARFWHGTYFALRECWVSGLRISWWAFRV